jgi:hypothetical protein
MIDALSYFVVCWYAALGFRLVVIIPKERSGNKIKKNIFFIVTVYITRI